MLEFDVRAQRGKFSAEGSLIYSHGHSVAGGSGLRTTISVHISFKRDFSCSLCPGPPSPGLRKSQLAPSFGHSCTKRSTLPAHGSSVVWVSVVVSVVVSMAGAQKLTVGPGATRRAATTTQSSTRR